MGAPSTLKDLMPRDRDSDGPKYFLKMNFLEKHKLATSTFGNWKITCQCSSLINEAGDANTINFYFKRVPNICQVSLLMGFSTSISAKVA